MYIQYSIEIPIKIFDKKLLKNSGGFMVFLCRNFRGFYLNLCYIEYKIVG